MSLEELKNKIDTLYDYLEDNKVRGKKRLKILIEIQDLENELSWRYGYASDF